MAAQDPSWEALFPVRNAFYLGNVAELQKEHRILTERRVYPPLPDVYLFRSHVYQQNYEAVFRGVNNNSPAVLQVIKLHASYKNSNEDSKDVILATLQEFLETLKDPLVQLIAAQIYVEERKFKEALMLVHEGDTLELMALCVQIYLEMNRVDLAEKQVRAMQEVDDEDTLTQLCAAWVGIAIATESKVTESYMILQELVEKFGPSVLVVNSLAVCQLHLRKYNEAFDLLKEARELALSSGQRVSPDTLMNTIICMQHLKKSPELIAKVVTELQQVAPDHPYFKQNADFDALFDQCASIYAS